MTSIDTGDQPAVPVPPASTSSAGPTRSISSHDPHTPVTPATTAAPARPRHATPSAATSEPRLSLGDGNIYTPHAGSMIIQVQRESGLQSRTIILSPRQVRILGFLTSRTGKLLAAACSAAIVLVALEAARVPLLTSRIARMEHTADRLDTLERSLTALQKRYDQVRTMMGADAATHVAATLAPTPPLAPATATAPPGDAATGAGPAFVRGTRVSPTEGLGAVSAPVAATPVSRARRSRRRARAASADTADAAEPDSGAAPNPQAEPQ